MGPKRGVISQSVKDVIQSLVDDDLVAKDKIGISVSGYAFLYWILPQLIFICFHVVLVAIIYCLTLFIIM